MWLLSLLLACATEAAPGAAPPAPEAAAPAPDPLDAWLAAPVPPADGFASPVGSGWRACGPGCWASSSPRDVRAVAAGEVVAVSPAVQVRHLWYEDQRRIEEVSTWTGLDPAVRPGQVLAKGDVLGRASDLTVAITGDTPLEELIATRDQLFVPQDEPLLALISHDRYELRLYRGGREQERYAVSFGQEPGDKQVRGDNRTPAGMYFVVSRSQGPFEGPTAPYFGGHWIKLNYPNAWDAARGAKAGLITPAQQRAITRAWRQRALTDQGTRLGSGIGLHGWAREWDDAGSRRLSWGCVVLHLRDVGEIYAALAEGTMVVLL